MLTVIGTKKKKNIDSKYRQLFPKVLLSRKWRNGRLDREGLGSNIVYIHIVVEISKGSKKNNGWKI